MSLTIYTGPSGAGKSTALFQHIIEESMRDAQQKFYVIVPEQSTMQTQKDIVRLHPHHGILNIDVLSFNRLAYRVFGEIGFRQEALLEEIGKTFLLEKIALEESEHLQYFGKTLQRQENLAEMKAALSELMLYGVSPKDLVDSAKNEGEYSPFELKTADIAHVYRCFQRKLSGSFMTAEEVPDKLCEVIHESQKVKGAVVVLDGFTGFTPIQMKLIETLLPMVREMYVTVTLDSKEAFAPYRRQDLFAMSFDTLHQLQEAAMRTRTAFNPIVFIDGKNGRFRRSRELSFLASNIFRRGNRTWKEAPKDVQILASESLQDEISEIARQISYMVRKEGYRYRDIAIVTGDLPAYDNYVRQVFQEWEIPYFLDEKRNILSNPFIEYLRAALAVCAEGYHYDDMFRMLKSGMTEFDRTAIEHLENYVLGMGIRGRKKWRSPFLKHYRGEDPAEVPALNTLRAQICELLDPLSEAMAKRGSTVREKSMALYEFCIKSRAEEKLKAAQEKYEAEGRNGLAREYAQVYPYVMNVLDKLVDVLGNERISQKDYQALLEAAFREARVAIIPPGADRVLVGDMERSRLADIKVLFFAGVNEGIIPKAAGSGGILSDADRTKLAEQKINLRPTAREAMYIERFYLYLTLTKPQEKLILSYSLSQVNGEAIRPAYLVETVRRLFPALSVQFRERGECSPEKKATGIRLLTEGIAQLGERPLQPEYLELFSFYKHDPDYDRQIEVLLEAAETRMPQDQIGRAAAEALYGRNLRNSASRLEEFCACQFRHFLRYGLKLKEQPEFAFSGMERGNLLHRSLEVFADRVRKEGLSWGELHDEEQHRGRIASESLQQAVEESGGDILYDSARNEYQIERMARLMNTSVWALSEFLHAGDFDLSQVEAAFQSPELLDTMNIDLPNAKMTLTGRIDRIDTFEENGTTWVKIIDYKTGSMEFDLTQVFHGLQIQLVVYLNAAMEMMRKSGKNPQPAGVFYYQIQDPMLNYLEGEDTDEIRRRMLQKLKASGVVLDDREVLKHFDKKLGQGASKSDILPIAYKKDGSLTAASKALSMEQFDIMEQYVARKVKETAGCIMRGDAKINPYSYGNRTACDFCPYRGICGFDRRIAGYEYRALLPMRTDEVIRKMEEGEDE